jgi:DNA-binding CsgD family transcriptional regulator
MFTVKHILMDSNQLYNKIIAEYKPLFDSIDSDTVEKYSKLNILVNEFSRNEHSVKAIFDSAHSKILTVSENFETITGFTREEARRKNYLLFLQVLSIDQYLVLYQIIKNVGVVSKKMALLNDVDHNKCHTTTCGFKLKHKNGSLRQAMFRFATLEVSKANIPTLSAVTGEDVTHLLKPDTYWLRMTYGDNPKHAFHYSYLDKKLYNQDIVSDREKEVLHLIAEGLESKEIAEKLYISSHTVDHHRRNALARTGARDTTALIQLCRLCNIL